MPNRRAVIYTRILNDSEGHALGVERQEEDCRKFAERHRDLDVVAVLTDNDISASTASTKARPAYAEMIKGIRARQVDVVIAYSNSRLTRRPLEYAELIGLHQDFGVQILTVVSGSHDLSTADGRAIAMTVAIWDAAEAERTSERVKRAARQRREKGEWHGGSVPYGYRVVGDEGDRRLVLEPVEADRIQEAARRLLAGDSMYGICTGWNAAGSTTKRVAEFTVGRTPKPTPEGRHWRQGNLRAILLNPATVGHNRVSPGSSALGTAFTDEPVLDARTFERVGALLNDPSRNVAHSPGRRSAKYTMSGGLTVCGECGMRLVAIKSTRGEHVVLKCSREVSGQGACGRNRIDHDLLEAFVLEAVVDSLKSNATWLQRSPQSNPVHEAAIAALEAERDDLEAGLDRLTDALSRGTLDPQRHDRQAARLQAELDAVRGRLDGVLGQSVMSAAIEEGLDYSGWGPDRRRNFLKAALDRVEVSRDGAQQATRRLRQGTTIGAKDPGYAERREQVLRESFLQRVRFVTHSEAHAA